MANYNILSRRIISDLMIFLRIFFVNVQFISPIKHTIYLQQRREFANRLAFNVQK